MPLRQSQHKVYALFLCCLAYCSSSFAQEIDLVSISSDKAMLIIDGKGPKLYKVGSTIVGNIKLLSTEGMIAIIEINGKKQELILGKSAYRTALIMTATSVLLPANEQGQFVVKGKINGGSPVNMMVDTGASLVTIPASIANELGIDYRRGRPAYSSTANGIVHSYLIRLDSVKIGELELIQVDASVSEGEFPIVLLGMSFLKRLRMVREGEQMILTKK